MTRLPLYEFETSETPDYVPPSADPAGGGTAAPPEAATPTAAPPPPAAPEPEPLTLDKIADMMDERMGGLVGYLEAVGQQQPQPQGQPAPLPEWDPYNQDVVRQYWMNDMQTALREVVGPIGEQLAPVQDIAAHYAEQEAVAELETRFKDAADKLGGTFDHSQARLRAEHHVQGGTDVERAIAMGAAEQFQWERDRDLKAVEAYQAQARQSHEQQEGGPPAGAGSPFVQTGEGPPEGVDPFDWQLQRSISAAKGVQPVG